jgi:organic hydroperoxide reductase OsmC/OhrA
MSHAVVFTSGIRCGITVMNYEDSPVATGEVLKNGAGRFLSAVLRPKITVVPGTDIDAAKAIHYEIHKVLYCQISKLPVSYEPEFIISDEAHSGTV